MNTIPAKAIDFGWVRRMAARLSVEPALLALSDSMLARDVRSLCPNADPSLARLAVSLARQWAREQALPVAA
jgi:hypothetical protein